MSFSEFIKACNDNDNVNITHVICSTKNRIIAEYVKPPYDMNSLRLIFSMTKSITSLAIGIANDLGFLNIDDPIIKFFVDELPSEPHENLEKITIRHLLTMSSGIHNNIYSKLFTKSNWVSAFLAQEFPHEPGTYYRYNTHGSHMLSAIITKATSLSLEEFLNKYLFYPMGIYETQWELSPEKLTAGGMGLSLYPYSLVKISQLLLNDGVFNGKRLISKEYLDMATTQQIVKQDEINENNVFSGTGYGFQIHICKDKHYRFDGAFGQLCLICPSKNRSVIVFSQYSKMEALLCLIYKYLLSEECVFDTYIEPKCNSIIENIKDNFPIPLKIFDLYKNDLGIKTIAFSKIKNEYQLTMNYEDYCSIINFLPGHSTSGNMKFIKDLQIHDQKYVCYSTFNENLLTLDVFLIETPYVATLKFYFSENKIKLEFSINVSLTLSNETVHGEVHPT